MRLCHIYGPPIERQKLSCAVIPITPTSSNDSVGLNQDIAGDWSLLAFFQVADEFKLRRLLDKKFGEVDAWVSGIRTFGKVEFGGSYAKDRAAFRPTDLRRSKTQSCRST